MVGHRIFVAKLHDGGRILMFFGYHARLMDAFLWQSCDTWGVLVQPPSILMIFARQNEPKGMSQLCLSCIVQISWGTLGGGIVKAIDPKSFN